VALLDYDTGRVLYNVRDNLLPAEVAPGPTSSPLPNPSPSGTP